MARVNASAITRGFKGKVGNIVIATSTHRHTPTFSAHLQNLVLLSRKTIKSDLVLHWPMQSILAAPVEKEHFEHLARLVGKGSAYSMAVSDSLKDYRFSRLLD